MHVEQVESQPNSLPRVAIIAFLSASGTLFLARLALWLAFKLIETTSHKHPLAKVRLLFEHAAQLEGLPAQILHRASDSK